MEGTAKQRPRKAHKRPRKSQGRAKATTAHPASKNAPRKPAAQPRPHPGGPESGAGRGAPFVEAERLYHDPVGAPPFMPTATDRVFVTLAASQGYSAAVIGSLLRWETGGISVPTMLKHFKAELELGRTQANMTSAMRMYQFQTNPDPKVALRATMFWLERRDPLRWSPKHVGQSAGDTGRSATLVLDTPPQGVTVDSPRPGSPQAGPKPGEEFRFNMDRISAVSDPDALAEDAEDEE